eukprot:7577866-Pyramimonas_sp.AAC.1
MAVKYCEQGLWSSSMMPERKTSKGRCIHLRPTRRRWCGQLFTIAALRSALWNSHGSSHIKIYYKDSTFFYTVFRVPVSPAR